MGRSYLTQTPHSRISHFRGYTRSSRFPANLAALVEHTKAKLTVRKFENIGTRWQKLPGASTELLHVTTISLSHPSCRLVPSMPRTGASRKSHQCSIGQCAARGEMLSSYDVFQQLIVNLGTNVLVGNDLGRAHRRDPIFRYTSRASLASKIGHAA
jgi:hypothetical protein